MKSDLKITKINESLCFVDGNKLALQDLANYFTTFAANYRFAPSFKNGFWDGKIRHFSLSTQHLPIGLVQEVLETINGRYTAELDFEQYHSFKYESFIKFVELLDIKILDRYGKKIEGAKPRDYQLKSAYDAITKQHLNIEIPTSGGKTLISYMIARYMVARKMKMLMIVPTTTLVSQSFGDWYDFGWDEVRDCVHQIYGGQEKYFGSPITISTWQSLYKNDVKVVINREHEVIHPDDYELYSGFEEDGATGDVLRKVSVFEIFDCVLIDEAHGAKGKSLSNIAKWCSNAEWRIGMSGTLPTKSKEEINDYFNIVGALGPIKVYTSYKEMEEEGWIPQIKINCVKLRYNQTTRKEMAITISEAKRAEREAKAQGMKSPGSPFAIESDLINNLTERNDFLVKLIDKTCKGNTLVLFTKKSKHGVPLRELFEREFRQTKKILYIDGDISTEERNRIRKRMDVEDDIILLASFATFATGISIKNIHNIVFASNYKSKIKILQAIGRGLRKMDGKTKINIYDIIDDCSLNLKKYPRYMNYSMKHFKERKEIYSSKGLNWNESTLDLK